MKAIMVVGTLVLAGGCAVDATDEDVTSATEQAVSSTTKLSSSFADGSADIQYGNYEQGLWLMLFAQHSAMYGDTLFFDLEVVANPDPMMPQPPDVIRGWGTLPPGALTIGKEDATLTVALPADFYVERCSWGWWGGFECSPTADRPAIDLAWTRNGWYSGYRKTTEEQTFQGLTTRTKGTFWSHSADASGTFGAVQIANASGMMNDSKGSTVTREVVTAAP